MDSLSGLTIMKMHFLIGTLLTALFVGLTCYFAASSSGSTFTHKTNAGISLAVCCGLIAASLASLICFYRDSKLRNYSLFISLLSCTMLIAIFWYRGHESSTVIETLESTYSDLVASAAPFPTETEIKSGVLSKIPASYSAGYWVSSDRQSFELYYHDSSDSYTMKYPDGEWEWRGYDYSGPGSAR